ncbi:S-layer homology domain-containing protein [Paenibacillus caui]|uniref:S-layer homology domain-containing protein n=1 Tax=Paenibacillus caui TaxID=2873927 RepID=UPI001CA94BC9|nr:S-layer homology domain-containing protein [Paenibacillus caui]
MTQQSNGKKNVKQTIATMLLTLTFLTSGTAALADQASTPAASTVNSSATQSVQTLLFSDVASGFWAEKHIYKLASEGIILGNNGQFRPNDSVTQQEAITLAIRFMNLQDKLVSSAAPPENLKTTNYFKPYVALATQHKLIDSNEEIAATKAGESWGEKKASREWIAKILVRALGKDADAREASGKGTTFADNSTISSSSRGYVNVAVDLGLTKGVEGNRFDPLGSVTRAQIATFFSRGQAYVSPGYANVYEGVVTSTNDRSLTLYTGGQSRSFILDNRTAYYTKDSEKRASRSDIVAYSKVLVIDKVGSAAYVEITDPTQQLETIEGTLLRVLSGNKLLLLVNNDPQTIQYDQATSFLNQNGQAIKPEDMANDSTIVLKRETFTAEKKPVTVQVKSGLVNKTSSGTVETVDTASKTITVKEASGNEDKLVLNGAVPILYQGEVMELGDLKPGAVVSFTIKNNAVISIEVTQSVERTVKGTLIDIKDGKLLTYKKSDGSYAALQIADSPKVVVDGIANAGLSDLIADVNGGDQVELTLNADGVITGIQVLNRQSEQLTGISVVSYDSKLKLLTVIDSKNKPYVLKLDDKTAVDYNSSSPVLSGIEPLLTKDRKVTLTHIGERVLSISVIYQYEGSFVSLDTTNKKLKLLTSSGKTLELPYTSSLLPVYIFGKSNATVSDLKNGDPVTVMLNSTQDAVQSISVKTVKQFEIVSVDAAASRVQAKASGVSQSFYVDKAVLLNDSGATIKVSDLTAGAIINVAFNGTTASSVQLVKVTYGKVVSADASSLALKTFTGTSSVFQAAGSVKVVRGAAISTSLTNLTASDHVSIRKDADGSTIVTVLTPVSRTYWRYDSTSKELFVKKESLSDTNYRFALQPETYIHQGETTLTVQSLQENDNIVLYFDGDKLVEIEKQ